MGGPLPADLIPWFVQELSRRSLPFTADGFGLAADLVTDLVRAPEPALRRILEDVRASPKCAAHGSISRTAQD
jgi:hypothetical protein